MHAPEEKGMTARDWNRNQEKITRLRDLAAAVSGKMFLAFFLLVVCILCQQGVRGQARRIQLADFGKAVSVSDPQISPDGKSIVYVLSRMNMEQDRNDRDLVLHEIANRCLPRLDPRSQGCRFTAMVPRRRPHRLPCCRWPRKRGEGAESSFFR